ncbi:hypothetical protein LINGRAHAP2_LOCUS31699 [Linum grandiflorum]
MDSSGGSTSRGVVADDGPPAPHTIEKIKGNWHLEVIKAGHPHQFLIRYLATLGADFTLLPIRFVEWRDPECKNYKEQMWRNNIEAKVAQNKENKRQQTAANRVGAMPYNYVQSQLSKELGHMLTRAQIWLHTLRKKDGSFRDAATPLALSDRPSSATGPSEHVGWSQQTEASITARIREEMDRAYAEKLQAELERHSKLGNKKTQSMAKKIEKKMEKKMEQKFQEMFLQFTSKGLSSYGTKRSASDREEVGSDDDVNGNDFIVEPLDNARYKKAFHNSDPYEHYDEDEDEDEDLDKDGNEYNANVEDDDTDKGGDDEEEEDEE